MFGTVLASPVNAAALTGNSQIQPTTDENAAGLAEAYKTTASVTGVVRSLQVFVASSSTASAMSAGLYDDRSGHPGNLLAQGTLSGPVAGVWNEVVLATSVTVTAGGVYWIALLGPVGAGTLRYRDNCCGSGQPAETSAANSLSALPPSWSTGSVYRDGPLAAFGSDGASSPPPSAGTFGRWDGPVDWPLVPVHMELQPNGKVRVWDGFEFALNSERTWDPATGQFVKVPTGINFFCSAQVSLADGRGFVAGGHVDAYVGIKNSAIFDSTTNKWTNTASMTRARWYPTATALPDGRVLVVSGDNISLGRAGQPPALANGSDTLPEIYSPTTNSWSQLPSAARLMPLYPFMFVLPDGRVLDAGPDTQTRTLDLTTGTWSPVATSPIDGHSAVMYAPGRILKTGTWAETDFPGLAVTNRAAILDMNQPNPAWREVAPMAFPRSYHTLTALPDGTVLASGGGTQSDGHDPAYAVFPDEIWNPTTETWATVASHRVPRLYHSSALLLPDGRVLLAGGGRDGNADNHLDAEIFSPPYLFKGARPTITSAPLWVNHGTTFSVATPDAARVATVTLLHIGSVTHNFDQAQRSMTLNFQASGGTLQIQAPANANMAPPGVYMLSIVDTNGVPSVSTMITLPTASVDSQAPTAPTGLTASGSRGAATLSWTASTDNVGVTAYNVHRSATPGFSPSTANRIAQVTGTSYSDPGLPAGTYYYRVTAQDSAGNVSGASSEVSALVTGDTTPPAVSITAPASGASVSAVVVISATSSDDVGVAGVQFKLDGANLGIEGSANPYSVNWDTRAATNGSHVLTAVARDTSGNQTTSSPVTVTVSNTGPSGLVAAYAFREGSGTTVADASGQGNKGTLSNVTWVSDGRFGTAASFNGVNSSVAVPDSSSLDLTTGMTLEAWVRPSATMGSAWKSVILKEQTGNLVYSLYANTDTKRPSAQIAVPGDVDTRGTAQVAANAWTHLASTYDGTTLRLFVNGTQVSSKPSSGAMIASAGALKIGGNAIWGEWFKGAIDEVRIYSRGLTAAEIQSDMISPV